MRKIKKISRYLKAVTKPKSSVPIFWHVGRPNFGDDINPEFFQMLTGKSVRLATDQSKAHFLGMGSILEKSNSNTTILGSGLIAPLDETKVAFNKAVAVRGTLTKRSMGLGDEVLLGDPMVLLDQIFEVPKHKSSAVGFIPHVTEISRAKSLNIKNLKIIDPSMAPMRVIRSIADCDRIISQSLHGLIVADALNIPNLWIAPSITMKGGEFKFNDYFSTLDSSKKPHAFVHDSFHLPDDQFVIGNYKYDKRDYLEALIQSIRDCSLTKFRE